MLPQNNDPSPFDDLRAFSESRLWSLQSEFYQQEGIQAFADRRIPHYITNSPQTAQCYAEMAFGFLRDIGRQGNDQDTVYLIELGAGTGKLCFHFLQYCTRFLTQTPEAIPPFCYVLSDLPEDQLDFWLNHPRLQQYFRAGLLDVARFDAVNDQEMHLVKQGITLGTGSCSQPLLVLANYFFDVIPQELFYFESGQAYQVLLGLDQIGAEGDGKAGSILSQLQFRYGYDALDASQADPHLQPLIHQYREVLEQSHVLLPHLGIRTVEVLRTFSPQGLLLLTGDKGMYQLGDLDGLEVPELVLHGSGSFYLNFHALGAYCNQQDGRTFFPAKHKFNLVIAAFLFVRNPILYPSFAQAFDKWASIFGPDERYLLKSVIERGIGKAEVDELVALLRYFLHDAKIFQLLYSRLEDLIPQLNPKGKEVLAGELLQVWENYYALDQEEKIEAALQYLLGELGQSATLMTTFP